MFMLSSLSSYSVLDPSPLDGASTLRGLPSQLIQTRYSWVILDPAEMTVLTITRHLSLPTRRESTLPVRIKNKPGPLLLLCGQTALQQS